ncbi:MAG: hypothetical protein N3A38_00710 [Planctomycetota bacterium]|nr:hypothetical protein [Planctomycetota bacterium]
MFEKLLAAYGPQRWWPGETPFEVMVGAILTQNAAWRNVEKAIASLKAAGRLDAARMLELPPGQLAGLIRPAGYFNVKEKRLRAFLEFFRDRYGADVEAMRGRDLTGLRRELLAVNGIGRETADSILLYALDKPVFVVDAYTRRVFSRHGIARADEDYDTIRAMVEGAFAGGREAACAELPEAPAGRDARRQSAPSLRPAAAGPASAGDEARRIYNEFHALLVRVGKEHCGTRPRCRGCPLEGFRVDRSHARRVRR